MYQINLATFISALSEYPEFLDKIVEDYIINSPKVEINRAACRLLLLTLPGQGSPLYNSSHVQATI